MPKRVGLIMAMEAEAAPLIRELGLKPVSKPADPQLPFVSYQGVVQDMELTLSLNGKDARSGVDNIGSEPAALCAYVHCKTYSPELLINAGTAGGFRKHGGKIGDIYLSAGAFCFHDHRIPIPGFEQYGIGSFPTLDVSKLAKDLGFKTGVVSTGNSLDYTDACLKLMDSNQARVKEMEAAAIAWVAMLLRVPFFAVKSVTDIVDGEHPTAEEFLRNLELASRNLSSALLQIFQKL